MGAYKIDKNAKGYWLFTITRNEKRNAINYEVMDGLLEVMEQAKSNQAKALVITGSGDQAFCSGGDLSVFHSLTTKEEAHPMLAKMAAILYELAIFPMPTIAIMNGYAVGGGMELAAACDFRLARKGIKAGFVQGKQAITTGWGGASLLSEKIAVDAALKLLITAELYTAEQLKEAGFVSDLYEKDPLEACEKYLEKILSIETSVLKAYKEVWLRKWEGSGLRERIDKEVLSCSILWESDAHHSYVRNFIGKQNKL